MWEKSMTEFFRGARIKPRVEQPINAEIQLHEFMAIVGMYAVRDYKVDRATFLRYAELAYEAAQRATVPRTTEP
jgi:hypothetical protein